MDNKNLILAITLSVGILLIWSMLFPAPPMEEANVNNQKTEIKEETNNNNSEFDYDNFDVGDTKISSSKELLSVEESLKSSRRVKIKTQSLSGSINLRGLKIDDLVLEKYNQTLDFESEKIRFLSPGDTRDGFEIQFGWIKPKESSFDVPDSKSLWSISNDLTTLDGNNELKLEWSNKTGQIFQTFLSVDEDYLFAVKQVVINNSSEEIIINNNSKVIRKKAPNLSGMLILHEGPIGVLQEELKEIDYDDLKEDKDILSYESDNGWIGITDKYWLAALIPDQNIPFKSIYNYDDDKGYVAYFRSLNSYNIKPNTKVEINSKVFAGAKEADLLDRYQEKYNIYNFDLAIDWGWFYFITKPLFYAISYFYQMFGNFGIAIIILTVITRIVFFPLANWSFISMAKMKLLQPEMTRIKDLYKDDKQQQQQALMALYKKEKVNPVSGCLPILIQIPFFFAIYKMLFISIEMRHAPFYGWIKDLSVKDPTTLFNLFGLIPWDPPSFMIIGIWPILMGLTMYIQQKLNPAPPDPIQAKIFAFFPLFITILLSQFAAGLVIYWTTNNILSILQQWIITRRTKVKTN
tara:strand:- start:745 stop:2478 length:1734 start_codon:yes stop_codon:yes gene_type:complete